jgi:hypothetical protein
MRRSSYLVALLTLLAVGPLHAGNPTETLLTTGVVLVDPGASLGGILVVAAGEDGVIHEARTDITGRFTFIGLPEGEVTFVATHRIGKGWQTSNRVKAQAFNRDGEVRLSMVGAPENFCNCACPIYPPRPYDFGYCQYCLSCGG